MPIATLCFPVNNCEAAPILTESPTWQLGNNSKPIVAGFCHCQKKKKKLFPKSSELFALLRNLINVVGLVCGPSGFIACLLTLPRGGHSVKTSGSFCCDWRNPTRTGSPRFPGGSPMAGGGCRPCPRLWLLLSFSEPPRPLLMCATFSEAC